MIRYEQVRELHKLYWVQRNLMRSLSPRKPVTVPSDYCIRNAHVCEHRVDEPGREISFGGPSGSVAIDFEQYAELGSEEKLDYISSSGIKCNFDFGTSRRTEVSRSMCSQEYKEKTAFGDGLNNHDSTSNVDLLALKQRLTLCEYSLIDLNAKVDADDCHVLDHPSLFTSPSTSFQNILHRTSHMTPLWSPYTVASSWRETNTRFSKETYFETASRCSTENYSEVSIISSGSMKAAEKGSYDWYKVVNNIQSSAFESPGHPSTEPAAKCTAGVEYLDQMKISGLSRSIGFNQLGDNATNILPDHKLCHSESESIKQVSIVSSSSNSIANSMKHATVLNGSLQTLADLSKDKQDVSERSNAETFSSHSTALQKVQKNDHSEESLHEENFNHNVKQYNISSLGNSTNMYSALSRDGESAITTVDSSIAEVSPCKETTGMQNCDSCSLTEMKINATSIHHCCAPKKPSDASEIDCMIKIAAETLVYISLDDVSSNQIGSCGGPGLNDGVGDDKPQCSSDSFESLILMLSENRFEDHSTCLTDFSKDTGKEACGVRMRRGRTLRDFQKETLPGLVSLSRTEMCQDLHSIGYDPRKNRSRNREIWYNPVKRKRSCTYRGR